MSRATPILAAVAAMLFVSSNSCDPGGPGASGTISLPAGLEIGTLKTLELRAAPDSGSFDAANPRLGNPSEMGRSDSLDGKSFPSDYFLGGGVGTTPDRRWRLLAWLDADGEGDGPESGEPYGTTTFSISECGACFGDYCDTRSGVNLTLDAVAP